MSKKTVLRFKTKELNALVNNTNAQVKLITSKRKISLHPNCLNDVKSSVHEVLGASLGKFDDELQGILLSYKNIKVLKNLAKVLHDDPYLYVTIRADFYVFVPEVGCTLFGIVNKKSPDHIGCLVHKVFNVALPRPESDTGKEWQGFYAKIGQMVTFIVEYIDLTGSLPYMRGRLLDIGINHKSEENFSNADSGEADDNEEELSTSQKIKDLINNAASSFMLDKKPKKRRIKKEDINFDSTDFPERVSDNLSSSQSTILDESEKRVKLKKMTKESRINSQSHEFELDDDLNQEDTISFKTKEKGLKDVEQNEYKSSLTDFDNVNKTVSNLIDAENKFKKKKHKNTIKQESSLINDVKVFNSEMEEDSKNEGKNMTNAKTLESADTLGPKLKKKKKKKKDDDAMFEADESILTKENLPLQNSMMLGTKEAALLKQITNSILSDDMNVVTTSTPKEHKGLQKFNSNVSEIKRRYSLDEKRTPKAVKSSKKQKIKNMTLNEEDFSNLANAGIDDFCNQIGKDAEVKVKKKERTKKANESNESLSPSSSGSPRKQKINKIKEQKMSGSMSEACNTLLDNMLNKLSSPTLTSNNDAKNKDLDISQNVKSPKKRNLPSSSQSQKSPKPNKNQTFVESDDEDNKVKQTKKSDAISWELPDSIIEIQNNILEKLKSEMSPIKEKILESEMSPIKEKKLESEMSPIKEKKLKSEISPAKEKKLKSEMSPVKEKKLKRKMHSEDGVGDDITKNFPKRKVAKLNGEKHSEEVTDFEVSKGNSQIVDRLKEHNGRVIQNSDSSIKGQRIKNKNKKSEKLDSSIENEKEALLHKMLSSIAGVIKLESGDEVKLSKEAKKERKKSKQAMEVHRNGKNNVLIQSSDGPLENPSFQQKYNCINSVLEQDEKYKVAINNQEPKKKKKKKDKDKISFSEDGNVCDNIPHAIDGNISLNNISNANTIESVAKKANSKKTKQKGQTNLMSSDDYNETIIKLNKKAKLNDKVGIENLEISHLASEAHKQEKEKKAKTKRKNDKIGLPETKEPDHRKKEKRHSVISQDEEESPAALAERLLQEFIKQQKM